MSRSNATPRRSRKPKRQESVEVPALPDSDPKGLRAYVEHWRRVGPILQQIRDDELRLMTAKERRRAIASVLSFSRPDVDRPTSGLVEWYKMLQGQR